MTTRDDTLHENSKPIQIVTSRDVTWCFGINSGAILYLFKNNNKNNFFKLRPELDTPFLMLREKNRKANLSF